MGNTTALAIGNSAELFFFILIPVGATVLAMATKQAHFYFFAMATWLLFTYHEMSSFSYQSAHWYMGLLAVVMAMFMAFAPFVKFTEEEEPEEDEEDEEEEEKEDIDAFLNRHVEESKKKLAVRRQEGREE